MLSAQLSIPAESLLNIYRHHVYAKYHPRIAMKAALSAREWLSSEKDAQDWADEFVWLLENAHQAAMMPTTCYEPSPFTAVYVDESDNAVWFRANNFRWWVYDPLRNAFRNDFTLPQVGNSAFMRVIWQRLGA